MSFNLVLTGSYALQLHEISPITSNHGNPIGQHTSTHSNPIGQDTSIQSNPIGDGASTQSNSIGEGDSSGSHARTLVVLTNPEINWRGVSNDIREEYFGEFKV
ncbi:hypothetical protein KY289_026508 [Solanum tuberosum]|nr:hypothetical protein KY289_026508 [Solanum tuberosum]